VTGHDNRDKQSDYGLFAERIRAKIAELEVKLANLRIAERELMALEQAPARKTTAPRTPLWPSFRSRPSLP
jgi:hypothetical protein